MPDFQPGREIQAVCQRNRHGGAGGERAVQKAERRFSWHMPKPGQAASGNLREAYEAQTGDLQMPSLCRIMLPEKKIFKLRYGDAGKIAHRERRQKCVRLFVCLAGARQDFFSSKGKPVSLWGLALIALGLRGTSVVWPARGLARLASGRFCRSEAPSKTEGKPLRGRKPSTHAAIFVIRKEAPICG